MSSPRQTTCEHPVLDRARELAVALDDVAELEPGTMSTRAKAEALVELTRVADRVQGLLLRVLAVADDVALDDGARSAAAWLAHRTRTDRVRAARWGRLASAVDRRWRTVGASLLAGDVSLDQADVIVAALERLPADLAPDVVDRAETHLVSQGAHFDAARLRVLGRRVLEVVAPEVCDHEEQRQLEAEERRAAQQTRLTVRTRGDGSTDLAIRVPDPVAARLKTYLEAYAAPRRGHLDPTAEHTDPDTGERLPYPVLLGRAFCALLEAVPADRLPRHGGSATSVVVTIDHASLRARVGAADLDTGQRISAGEALRLACNAGIMPLVLDGSAQPLHLGRARRLFGSGQRTAMAVRDRECRADGCDIPAAWCEAHHLGTPWSRGGRTDLDQGALLCSFHHHRAHDPTYAVDLEPGGELRFRRRT